MGTKQSGQRWRMNAVGIQHWTCSLGSVHAGLFLLLSFMAGNEPRTSHILSICFTMKLYPSPKMSLKMRNH